MLADDQDRFDWDITATNQGHLKQQLMAFLFKTGVVSGIGNARAHLHLLRAGSKSHFGSSVPSQRYPNFTALSNASKEDSL